MLAAVRSRVSGMPFRSTRRWCFEPGLPLSVGLGPVSSPPFLPRRWRSLRLRGSSRSLRLCLVSLKTGGASFPRPLQPATPGADANTSCHYRSPSPWGAFPRVSRCEGQRGSLSVLPDPAHGAVRLSASASLEVATEQSAPTVCHREEGAYRAIG